MIQAIIRDELEKNRDLKYRAMQIRLLPTVAPDCIIGVRTPALRAMAASLSRRDDIGVFLNALPHATFEENQLHAFIISRFPGFQDCLAAVNSFLPCVDNWATCDQMSPSVFRKHREELTGSIREWIASDKTYTIRFGIKMLMEHFLDEAFDPAYPALAAAVRSEEYYVNMMIAWYFATALAKQYDVVLPYISERRLDPWTHNKTIQKSIESFRITPEHKEYLKTLRIR